MNAAAQFIKAKFPAEVVEVVEFRGDDTVVVKSGRIKDILTALRDDENLSFKYLSMVTAIDYSPASPRFALVYNLYSHKNHDRITLKAFCEDDSSPVIDSVFPVFSTADWHEREAYDLMGIRFKGHPNLKRILMPDDFVGHPLRKEYPIRGE